MLFSYVAAYEGVPTVFLSGDKSLCEEGEKLHPMLHVVAVKEGIGSSVISMVPSKALKLIRETSRKIFKTKFRRSKNIIT